MNGKLVHFRYSVSGEEKIFTSTDLFYDKVQNLRSDIRGKSPMDRALAQVNIDLMNYQTVRAYLLGDNKPAAILTPRVGSDPISPEEQKRLLKLWSDMGKGAHNGYKTRMLNAPYELQSFEGQEPNIALSEDARKTICIEFGVDPALLGAVTTTDPLGASTTLQEKRIIALIYTIRPDLFYLERYINDVIMPWIAPEVQGVFAWDYTNIDTMIKYSNDAIQQSREDVKFGLMTINEYRSRRSLPALTGGDTLMTLPNVSLVGVDNFEEFVKINEEDKGIGLSREERVELKQPVVSALPEGEAEEEDSSKALLDLANWHGYVLSQPDNAKDYSPSYLDYPTAQGIRYQLGRHNLSDRKIVNRLFRELGEIVVLRSSALKADRLYNEILFATASFNITDEDVDESLDIGEGILNELLNSEEERVVEGEES